MPIQLGGGRRGKNPCIVVGEAAKVDLCVCSVEITHKPLLGLTKSSTISNPRRPGGAPGRHQVIFKYAPDVGLKVGALFPLLPIPSSTPSSLMSPLGCLDLTPSGPLTWLTQLTPPPPTHTPIYNGPIDPLREFYAPWRPHTVRWERGKCTFVMNFIICIKNRWKLGIPAERLQMCVSMSLRGARESPLMSHQEHRVVSCFNTFTVNPFEKKALVSQLFFSGWLNRCFPELRLSFECFPSKFPKHWLLLLRWAPFFICWSEISCIYLF